MHGSSIQCQLSLCILATVSALSLSACSNALNEGSFEVSGNPYESADGIDQPDTITEALLGGTPTQDRTEIGRTNVGGGSCTGTLITPQVMLSARHCLQYTTCESTQCVNSWGGGYATFQDSSGREHRFGIERWTSFDRHGRLTENSVNQQIYDLNATRQDYWLSDDVALVRLTDPVPSSIATPSSIAAARPSSGDALTVWGYGCTERATQTGGRLKRYRDFSEGISRSNNLCPGDSGGPVTTGRQGEVLYVNSAYATTGDGVSRDVFGDVLFFEDLILAELAAWGEDMQQNDPTTPVEPDEPEQPVDPVEPDEPEQPVDPVDPGADEPDEPEQPATPVDPPATESDVYARIGAPIAFDDGSGFGLLLPLTESGTFSELQLDMEIQHARPEEIMIIMHMPDGTRLILDEAWSNSSTYRSYIIPNFWGLDVSGDWIFEFHDVSRGNTGYLQNFELTWVR